MFEELQLFKTKHGHMDVSTRDAGNRKIGRWVSNQHHTYKQYKAGNKQKSEGICEERINQLENIEFNWVSEYASPKQQIRDEMFEELKIFISKHGHTDVPAKYEDNPKLGPWVSNQRYGYTNYKAGNKQKSQGMCEERINKLESIDFKWTVKLTRKQTTSIQDTVTFALI